MIDRRDFLKVTGAAAAAAAGQPGSARASPPPGEETIVLTTVVAAAGTYEYLPFEVPGGVNRVAASLEQDGSAALGVGLFDQRGPHYQSSGFRGVYGEERGEFFVAAHEASQSFIPGPIEPGTWTVIVAAFRAPRPQRITVRVTLTYGPQRGAFRIGRTTGVVRDGPDWYRGDLHCHTPESSDAWIAGDALTPAGWADECRRIGLDFVALTDHNVVSQNFSLARDAGRDVLLMAGEEMTNWFHGHATVAGMEPTDWLDWRQRPEGVPLQAHEARITDFLGVTREMGAYVSAAHPLFAQLSWQFFADAESDPAAATDGIEVWTGQFRPDCQAALDYWDSLLARGRRIVANGGSDLHGVDNDLGFVAGTPTTVVHAERLSTEAVVAALRRGRSFVTRVPDGVEAYLSVRGPDGQRQISGGAVFGGPDDLVDVAVVVRRAAGMRAAVVANGAPVWVARVNSDDETVHARVPIGAGGYVRAEVRSASSIDPDAPFGSRMDMEAFTNPVFLVQGAPPDDSPPDNTPPPTA